MIAAFSAGATGVLVGAAAPAFAAEEATAPAVDESGPPTDWGLTKQYYPVSTVCRLVVGSN